MPRKLITVKMLREAGVCDERLLRKFKERWPKGCYVTRANCLEAGRWSYLALAWAVGAFLSPTEWNRFTIATNPAFDAWNHTKRPAKRKLRKALAQADADAFWKLAKGVLR